MYTFGGVLFVVVDAPRGVRVHHPRVLRASLVAVVVVDYVFVDVLFVLVWVFSQVNNFHHRTRPGFLV